MLVGLSTYAQDRLIGLGYTISEKDGNSNPTFVFEINRTDESKQKSENLAFFYDALHKGTKRLWYIGLYPTADINLGKGVESSINNVSAGFLANVMSTNATEGQSKSNLFLGLNSNSDRSFNTSLSLLTAGYSHYFAFKNIFDGTVGLQYHSGNRSIQGVDDNNNYRAPEFFFGLNYSKGIVSANYSFKNLYLAEDAESITTIEKHYGYHSGTVEIKLKSKKTNQLENLNGLQTRLFVKYENGRRAPLFQRINTFTFGLSFYTNVK